MSTETNYRETAIKIIEASKECSALKYYKSHEEGVFKDFLIDPAKKTFLGEKKITNFDDLRNFISNKSAFVSQFTLYGYLRTRMGGINFYKSLNDVPFGTSVNIARWNIYLVSVQDLLLFTFSYIYNKQDRSIITHADSFFKKILEKINLKLHKKLLLGLKKLIKELFKPVFNFLGVLGMFFNLKGKVLAGNITRYLNSDSKADAGIHGITQSLRIKAGTLISNTFYGIDLNTTNCSFTNRVGVDTAFTQNIDWRMVQNPASLADVFKYETQS